MNEFKIEHDQNDRNTDQLSFKVSNKFSPHRKALANDFEHQKPEKFVKYDPDRSSKNISKIFNESNKRVDVNLDFREFNYLEIDQRRNRFGFVDRRANKLRELIEKHEKGLLSEDDINSIY